MEKKLRYFAGILLILLIPIEFWGCKYFKAKPSSNLEFILRPDLGDLLRGMSKYNPDSLFNAAIEQADSMSYVGDGTFMDEMTKIYSHKNAEGKLAPVFVPILQYSKNIRRTDPNEKVLQYLNAELQKEFNSVYIILKTRIEQFGGLADMKSDYASGEITIGVNLNEPTDKIRLEKLLQTRGKLEFWNTYENEELINNLIEADKALGTLMMKTAGNDSNKLNPILKILYPRADNQNGVYPGPAIGAAFGKDTAKINEYFRMDIVRSKFQLMTKIYLSYMP
jgi:SecD/SecF fusion protein